MLDFLGRGPREESRGGDRVGKELARISHGIFSQETSENLSLTLESSPFLLWTLTDLCEHCLEPVSLTPCGPLLSTMPVACFPAKRGWEHDGVGYPDYTYRCGADVPGSGGILLQRQFIPRFAKISRGFHKFPVLQGTWIRMPKEEREFKEFDFHIKMIRIRLPFPITFPSLIFLKYFNSFNFLKNSQNRF